METIFTYQVKTMSLKIGIDVGSTTVKVVVLDEQDNLLFRSYERHLSMVREKTCELLRRAEQTAVLCWHKN